ncbi:hypothetical protein TrRE_jg4255 [Triparma retinervis]|uniref:Tr-type G domain-containing protein n=1 Tax=Triparma retinervis TaxID=2557542 RepID=A0A9W7A3K8_9STRA|nr:hypothetical protein TrRE_jg4255 [Triparma retinervis]
MLSRIARNTFRRSYQLRNASAVPESPTEVILNDKMRNLGVVAHIDHGKTSLVDKLLQSSSTVPEALKAQASQVQGEGQRLMDSGDLEQERGITITSKPTRCVYKDHIVNIVDTPGHADFAGEVDRILSMVDGVCLVVDGGEGVMSQTKYVMERAVHANLQPIVFLNKLDREGGLTMVESGQVETEIFDLFIQLGANDEQLEYPTYYGSAKMGWVTDNLDDAVKVVKGAASPDAYGMEEDKKAALPTSITGVFAYEGVERAPLPGGVALPGDIVTLSGVPDTIAVGDTLTGEGNQAKEPIDTPPLNPPTLSMDFGANDGPLAGKEGTIVQSSRIRARLQNEVDNNVTLSIGISETDGEKTVVYARGELQLGILIEQMRREGYEMTISPPKIVFSKSPSGDVMEPFEEVTVDVDSEYSGAVMSALTGDRKATMMEMNETDGKVRMKFEMPTRALLGFGPEALTMTRGSAVVNHTFVEMRDHAGPLGEGLEKGKLVCSEAGKATGYALNMIGERGSLFVEPGDEVYPGMVVGENSRAGDLDVNAVRAKGLTNVRTVLKEEKANIAVAEKKSVEEIIAYMGDDEVIEVTPLSVRLRKRVLDAGERSRIARVKKQQREAAKENKAAKGGGGKKKR